MKRLTPACMLLLKVLCSKYYSFGKRYRLDPAGTFYYDDKRLGAENGLSKRTVVRAVQFLQKQGLIWCQRGLFKGRATRYKPTPEGFIVAGYKIPEGVYPSAKDVQQSSKGGPFDAPKKVIKREIKNEHFESLTDEQEKERQRAFADCIKNLKAKSQKPSGLDAENSGEVPPCPPK